MTQETAAEIMAALNAGDPWSGGFPVRHQDGTIFPALVTDTGIYRDGALIGIIGVSTNLGTALRPLQRSSDAALVLRLRRYARAHNRSIRDVANDVTQGVLDLGA